MAHRTALLLILPAWLVCCAVPLHAQANAVAPASSPWVLTWSDEFNGPDGSSVDPAKWVIETGGTGWGNQELESYTARPRNVHVEGGNLVITALPEKYAGSDGVLRDFTSARLKTEGKFSQAYGRFEARIKIPRGQGMWPAFWMLGDNISKDGWPACGEIDIMENIGKEPSIAHGSIHGPGYTGAEGLEAPYTLFSGQALADDFHLYAVEWEPDAIRLYVDDHLYVTRTPKDLHPGWRWVFDHPFFLVLNLAVGGDWPGSPDATTVFPQNMLVDYVRVYRRGGRDRK